MGCKQNSLIEKKFGPRQLISWSHGLYAVVSVLCLNSMCRIMDNLYLSKYWGVASTCSSKRVIWVSGRVMPLRFHTSNTSNYHAARDSTSNYTLLLAAIITDTCAR